MTSEIRVNKIANRAGLSTVQYTDTGIIVSGIVTATTFSGSGASLTGIANANIAANAAIAGTKITPNFGSQTINSNNGAFLGGNLSISNVAPKIFLTDSDTDSDFAIRNMHGVFGIHDSTNSVNRLTIASSGNVSILNDLDVDGHTNLDNVSIAGVTTFSNAVNIANGTLSRTSTGSNLIFQTDLETRLFHSSNNHVKLTFYGSGETLRGSIEAQATQIQIKDSGGRSGLVVAHGAESRLYFNDYQKFTTTNTGAIVTGVLTATSFSGDGSSLSNLPAGAPVGGASTNTVFFENDKEVAVNYQITSTKNAMTAGPVSINAGIAVTVPSGCAWTIV